MRKLLIVILTVSFVIWLIKPETLKKLINKQGKVLSEKFEQQKTAAKKSVKNKSAQAAQQANNSIQGRVLQTANKVNEYLEEQTEKVLGINIGEEKPEVNVINDLPKKKNTDVILIDFLTNKGITLDMEINKIYYLDIRNPYPYPLLRCFRYGYNQEIM